MFKIWDSGSSGKCFVVRRLSCGAIDYSGQERWFWKKSFFKKEVGFSGRQNLNIAITGESGFGKSSACGFIVRKLCESGAKVLIIDPNNDHQGIAVDIGAEVHNGAYYGINIFSLDGVRTEEKIAELVGLFKRHFNLGYYQRTVLYRCIKFMYARTAESGGSPSLDLLLGTIIAFKKKASTPEERVLNSIYERISTLKRGSAGRSLDMERLMNSNNILELQDIHTEEAQRVYIEGLLGKIYATMMSSADKSGRRFYIILDEAGKVGDNPVLGRLASEGRKYGIGIISVAQRPKSLDKDIRANSSVFIAFYQREPDEMNYVANLISGGNEGRRFIEVKKALRRLSRATAVVMDSNQREPYIVRFPEIKQDPHNLDYIIRECARNAARRGEILRTLYSQGFTYHRVSSSLARMVESGKLYQHRIELESDYDGVWYITDPRNSAEHDIMVNVISSILDSKEVRNRVYNGPSGPDVIAYRKEGKIAFEYETGSKSMEQTQKMLDLRSKSYPTIVMIVNDNQIARYVGLKDVRVVMASEFLKTSP